MWPFAKRRKVYETEKKKREREGTTASSDCWQAICLMMNRLCMLSHGKKNLCRAIPFLDVLMERESQAPHSPLQLLRKRRNALPR